MKLCLFLALSFLIVSCGEGLSLYSDSASRSEGDVEPVDLSSLVILLRMNEPTGAISDGQSINDSSGNALSAQSGNVNATGMNFSSAVHGNGIIFDGVDDDINLADDALINMSGPYTDRTTCTWFYAPNTATRQVIFKEGGGTRGFLIYLGSGLLFVGGYDSTTWPSGTYHSTSISASTWYHVCLVLRNGTGTQTSNTFFAYINGSQFGAGDGAQVGTHSADTYIGYSDLTMQYHDGSSGTANYYSGMVDDFIMFNRALSDEEVSNLYNGFGDNI